MSIRIRRSAAAEADLLDIWLYVAEHDQTAADRLLHRLEEAVQRLVRYPLIGHMREEVAADLRLLLQDDYLIIYRYFQTESLVSIERVVHGRRDLGTLLP